MGTLPLHPYPGPWPGRSGPAQRELDNTAANLTFTKDQLEATKDDRDTTAARLLETEGQLKGTQAELGRSRGSLNEAQDRLNLQVSQIDTLQICLDGVGDSLRWAAGGFFDAALAPLRAVERPCRDANNIL